MSNTLFYLCLLLLSILRFLGPIRRWLVDATDERTAANAARYIFVAVTSLFSSNLFRLLLLAGSVLFASDRLKDIEFVNNYAEPRQRLAWQVITLPDDQLPRYVRIPDFVPVETTVEETRSRFFIPMGKALIYAADVSQSLPTDTAEVANVMSKLIDPETKKPILSLFATRSDDVASAPAANHPHEVVGLLETRSSLRSNAEDIFREDGYVVDFDARLIKEGVLPDSLAHLYIQLSLLVLLALAQPLTFVLQRNWDMA